MDLDDDLFADGSGPAVNHVRGRFQPKAKPRPRKQAIASAASSEKAIEVSSSSVDAAQCVRPVDVAFSGATSHLPQNEESIKSNDDSLSAGPTSGDIVKSQVVNLPSQAELRDNVATEDVILTEVTDPSADISSAPAPKSAMAGGKYQPKGKPQPKSVTFALAPSTVADDVKQKAIAETFTDDVTDKSDRLTDPVDLSLATSASVGTSGQLKENEGFVNATHPEVSMSDGCKDLHSTSEKAAGQNADIYSGLECFDSFPSQSTCTTDAGEKVGIQAQSSANFPGPKVCDAAQARTCPESFMTEDPVTCTEAVISNDDGGTQIHNRRLETEVHQTEAFPDLDTIDFMSEATIASGRRAGKYKPKPKGRTEMEKPISSMPCSDVVDSVMPPPNPHFVSSETECRAEGSVPDFQHDYVLDYSAIDLDDIIPPDPTTSKLQMKEKQTNLAETSHAGAAPFGNAQSEVVSRMAKKSRLDKSSLAGKETEKGKSAKQLRKHVAVPELVDESDDEACDNANSIAEPPSSTVHADDDNGDECQVKRTSQKKRAPRKSKKPVTENEKPVRKRKKANEASDQMTKEPPKKFPHSTRRRQRRVSKELLETPEDDIDHRRVPMKDLILLAEYRERKASKEAKTSSTPLTYQSTENPFHENIYHDEEYGIGSEHGSDFTGDQATPRFESSSQVINYQSYMKKTPVVRWSKQETELFYEAVGQFGTDFSMIQHLFPGRTRQQVKLKYKKEERQHPLRLHEAQTTRTTDVSHFEKVIEQLKQVAVQEGRDALDDSISGMTGEEMGELNPETNDGAEKVEHNGDGPQDVTKDDSPLKADENEDDDDDDIWNSYKCEY